MQVLDHHPYAWFLLEDEGSLYLDAHCSHSFFDYSVLIALNDAEVSSYRQGGPDYLNRLAHDIHYSAPAARGSRSPYTARNLSIGGTALEAAAHTAIMTWRKAQGI